MPPLSAFTFALLLTIAAGADAGPLVLVQDGQPRASIVTTGDPQAKRAAEEIQKYIEKMSGAKLPLSVEEAGAKAGGPAPVIYVGHTAAARAAGISIPKGFNPTIRPDIFEEEGYILETRGNGLYVAGNSDGPYQGTLYAAYALLEILGCRWFFPGAWGEVVPESKTIAVGDLKVASRPDFAVRNIWLSAWLPTSKEEGAAYNAWATRLGMTGSRDMYPPVGDGYLGMLLPPEEYMESHPEFFAMNKNGSREVPKSKRLNRYVPALAMLCLSNPDVLAESIKNLRAHFDGTKPIKNFTENGFGISPPDGAPFCYCEGCLASSQNFRYPDYAPERMQSEEFFAFAAKLAEAFPDKFVSTYAYSLREIPPQGVKIPPNVMVKYAPINNCAIHAADDPHCWRQQNDVHILRQWRRLTPHLIIRDYDPHLLTGLFIPENEMRNTSRDLPIYKQIGIKGLTREGRKVFMQTWLSYYITAKLLWNTQTDVPALKKDFYEKFFGPEAGPHVQAWWDACEEALARAHIHIHEDWLLNHIYTPEFLKTIRPHIEAARRAEATEAQRQRVETAALIADHLDSYAAMHEAEKALDYAGAAREAGRMLEIKKQIQAVDSFLYTLKEKQEARNTFTLGHLNRYEKLAALTDGREGKLVAPLPLEMKFRRDPFNQGVLHEWYAPNFDDKEWLPRSTFLTWDAQETADSAGHGYDGYGWYRGTVKIPAEFAGKPAHLWLGGAINEAWVWLNGEYVGHKPFTHWYTKQPDYDLDATAAARPGQDNVIAIRLWNEADIGGLYRRGFLWSPHEIPTPTAAAMLAPPSAKAPAPVTPTAEIPGDAE